MLRNSILYEEIDISSLEILIDKAIVVRGKEKIYPLAIDPHLFYPNDTGFNNFYGTRKTDGGRSLKYIKILADFTSNVDVLNSLGCGDSMVEKKIIESYGHNKTVYNAVDVSLSMLETTKINLHGIDVRLNCIHDDFSSPNLISKLLPFKGDTISGQVLSLIVGRTFGNHPFEYWASNLCALASQGMVLIDCYSIDSIVEEDMFKKRMREIVVESKSFFIHPMVKAGVEEEDIFLNLHFEKMEEGLVANFVVSLKRGSQEILAHQIRGIHGISLSKMLYNKGLYVRHKTTLKGQLAPMSAMILSEKK